MAKSPQTQVYRGATQCAVEKSHECCCVLFSAVSRGLRPSSGFLVARESHDRGTNKTIGAFEN